LQSLNVGLLFGMTRPGESPILFQGNKNGELSYWAKVVHVGCWCCSAR
jgi:hypothetical protein